MIVEIYYYSTTEEKANDLNLEINKIMDIVVPIKGKFLYGLQIHDNLIYQVLTTPASRIEQIDNNFIKIYNAYIQSKQALGPIMIENIVDLDREDVHCRNGILIEWAFYHEFRSVLIKYFSKYPTLRKLIGSIIYEYLENTKYADLIIRVIRRYDYDVHKNNDNLFYQAAMTKNYKVCKFLLEEKDCRIPVNIYKIFRSYGGKRFPQMWELFSNHADKVDWR